MKSKEEEDDIYDAVRQYRKDHAMTKTEILHKHTKGYDYTIPTIEKAMEEYAQQQLAPSEETKIKVYNRPSKEWYWMDIKWGNRHATGDGWLCVLPEGEELKSQMFSGDNRVQLSPEDCDIYLPEQPAKRAAQTDVATDDDWISVDKPPEFNGEYNVAWDVEDGDSELVTTTMEYWNGKWVDVINSSPDLIMYASTVKYWRPLPKPPKQ